MDLDEGFLCRVLVNNFSLSDYEADVYLTLLRNSKQPITDIANQSEVPRQRAYDVADSLQERGLVEIIDEYPKSAYAVPPQDAFQPVQEDIDEAVSQLSELHQTESQFGTEIAMFKNESTIEKYLQDIIADVRTSVAISFPYQLIEQYGPVFNGMSSEVHSKLIVSNIPEELIREDSIELGDASSLAAEVRGTPKEEPVIVCADREICFLWIGYSGHRIPQSSQGFYITSSELAFLFDRFITDLLWSQTKPIQISQYSPDLPQTFLRIQDCIEYIRSIRDEGALESLFVEVDGYDTQEQQSVSISGELLDYYQSDSDLRAYLVLGLRSNEGGSDNIATVGGWNTSVEDYEAKQITLRRS